MAEQNKSKLAGLFQSAKVRMLTFVVGVVVLVVVVAVVWHQHSVRSSFGGSAQVAGAPAINSVPGAGNPSDNYVQQQNNVNAENYKKARASATSFVPTITRPSFVGSESDFNQNPVQDLIPKDNSPKACPLSKVVYMYQPNPANCSVPSLQRAREAGVTAEELRCQACSCVALHAAGYTVGEMKDTGFAANELKQCGYTLDELIAAGYSAADLKKAGFSAQALRNAGFTAGQLAAAGFTPDELQKAGYSPSEIRELSAGNRAQAVSCDLEKLKAAHAQGGDAAQFKDCGVAALKAAGFSAKELKNAGFGANELAAAGFDAKALQAAGFSPEEIQQAIAGSSKDCSIENLRNARQQGLSAVALKNRGCNIAALKAAGFTAGELKAAGFSASALKNAGFTAQDLKNAGYSANELKAAGFSANALKAAGYSAEQLKNAGFSAAALKAAGYSAAELHDAGFSAKQLHDAGYSAAELKNAGFSAAQLKNAGFSAGALHAAGFSAAELKNTGFSAQELHKAGYSAAALKAAGFTPSELKAAGFTRGDLLRAGFNAADAGFPTAEQKPAATDPESNRATRERDRNFPDIAGNTEQAQLRALQEAQQRVMSQQQRQDSVQQMQGQMMMEAQNMMGTWSNSNVQTGQKTTVVEKVDTGSSNQDAKITGPVIKAGDVMFAVLDTSVNSDENTPILATVVMGQLKGAKLIGKFTRVDKRVLLNFNTINVPQFTHTFPANIVAIDPDTARTAISGYVDNHYLLRYGSLFASSFLSGLADGIKQTGKTVSCFGPFCSTVTRNLTPTEYVAVGFGNVGSQYANYMSKNFNTPPTIKIPGGTGIGLLFMSDVTLPQPIVVKNIGSVPIVDTKPTDYSLGGN